MGVFSCLRTTRSSSSYDVGVKMKSIPIDTSPKRTRITIPKIPIKPKEDSPSQDSSNPVEVAYLNGGPKIEQKPAETEQKDSAQNHTKINPKVKEKPAEIENDQEVETTQVVPSENHTKVEREHTYRDQKTDEEVDNTSVDDQTNNPDTKIDGERKTEHNKTVQFAEPDEEITEYESEEGETISRKQSEANIDVIEIERRVGVVPLPTVINDDNATGIIEKHPKTSEDEKLIREAIAKNEFLSRILQDKILNNVVETMYNREIKNDEILTSEGSQGSHMYVSVKGRYEVTVKGKRVNVFDDVRIFGELAILYNCKRNATIKALKPGRVFVLDRQTYQKLMITSNIAEQDECMRFLMNVPRLNAVGEAALGKVASLLKSQFYPSGTTIIEEGDVGDKFYIIKAGSVTISKANIGVVDHRKYGDYFGELALLKSDKRAATVVADPPGCELLSLEREEFIAHFGELENIKSIPEPVKIVNAVADEYDSIHFKDLVILKTLGVGGFGRVELVAHKDTSNKFALKYLKKIDMVELNQQEHVKNERNIQKSCRSKFIVRLYRSYKDDKYIYFLMEPCMGGDLWTLLQKQKAKRFKEKDARFIAACVLESFAYLHERGIVYRDLKPENLMIDKSGYIKLTDFGFAKELGPRGRTYTFAGTPEYVAPEIIQNKGHDKAVDYWAFGLFTFELLTGRTPFRSNDPSHMKTYNRILNGIDNVSFPDELVPYKAKKLIEKLCRPKPSDRLGCQKNGAKDVKQAQWFLGFPWDKLEEGKYPSPFKPKLESDIDTRHFSTFKPDKNIPQSENSGWDVDF